MVVFFCVNINKMHVMNFRVHMCVAVTKMAEDSASKLNISTYFIMSSPTGEVDDVVTGALLSFFVRVPRSSLLHAWRWW